VLQLITNEIYMTTTGTLWKWGNGCEKEKREKEKSFLIFHFRCFGR